MSMSVLLYEYSSTDLYRSRVNCTQHGEAKIVFSP